MKMEGKSESDKLCILLFDEMQLKERVEMDQGLRRIVGYISPEAQPSDKEERATHAMVFMLRGLTSSWKQTVAYLFTGASTKREPLWDFTKQVIGASEAVGFRIQGVTSDMGPTNTGLWKHVGVESSRQRISSAIEHPCSPDRLLHFIADPPHLLKNLWNCVLTHRITLSSEIVSKVGLPSNVVTGVYVGQLLYAQHSRELRVAHKLKMCHIMPTQYQKMRVCLAAQFFSRSTAAAIATAVKSDLLPSEALTTAWFLDFVNRWFDAMNARHKEAALFANKGAMDSTKENILHEMLVVIKDLKFSGKNTWKPIQTGIQLSTTVALQLSKKVMTEYQLQYFLTGRLSQDPVENLFSQARGQGVMHPSCKVFRQALRLVTIAQYLQVSKGSAYEEDGCAYLVNYLKDKCKKGQLVDEENLLPAILHASEIETMDMNEDETALADGMQIEMSDIGCFDLQTELWEDANQEDSWDQSWSKQAEAAGYLQLDNGQFWNDANQVDVEDHGAEETIASISTSNNRLPHSTETATAEPPLSILEGNALYDLLGWTVSKVVSKTKCEVCKAAFIADAVSDQSLGLFTSLRSYGGLMHPSKELLAAAKIAEQIFKSNKPSIHDMENPELDITEKVLDALNGNATFTFPVCHRALQLIFKKYIRLRVNICTCAINTGWDSVKTRQYGSKTALRITLIT